MFVSLNPRCCLQEVNMRLEKYDELDSLIRGMQFVEANNPRECYYWVEPTDDEKCRKIAYDFSQPYPFIVSCKSYYYEIVDWGYVSL